MEKKRKYAGAKIKKKLRAARKKRKYQAGEEAGRIYAKACESFCDK